MVTGKSPGDGTRPGADARPGPLSGIAMIGLTVGMAVVAAAAGYYHTRPGYEVWRADLTERQMANAEARAAAAERARRQQMAEEAAAQAEAAMAASMQQHRAQPYAQPAPGGGYNPLAARPVFNPLAPSPIPPGPSFANPDVPLHPDFGLPDSDGVDLVYYSCTACHSVQTFAAQHVTRERWDDLLDWMVSDQNMAPLPPEERAVVLDYLVRHFGADHQAPGTLAPMAPAPSTAPAGGG